MDAKKYKRHQTQSLGHITQNSFGIPAPAPKAIYARTRSTEIIQPRQSPPFVDGITNHNRMVSPIYSAASRQIAVADETDLVQALAPTTPTTTPTLAPAYAQVRLPAFDMELPGEPSPSLFKRAKSRNVRKVIFRTTAIALVLLMTTGGLLVSQTFSKSNKVFSGTTGTAAALKKNVNPDLLKGEGAGRINVLLLGRGGGNHSGPDLTDTIIVDSIDPVNHTSTMFSVPRDLWVTVPQAGVMKLNAAWQTGQFKYLGKNTTGSTDPKALQAGFDLVDETLGGILGINIDYNVIVNFDAFKQAVDTVGGVNVNVATDLVDPTMAWENGNDPILAHAGAQAFDGKKALLYVRSRETSSDFARGERQRAVMMALKNKVDSLGTLSNPLKLSGLLNALGNNVHTDLSLANASRLYGITKQVTDATTTSFGFSDAAAPLVTTGNINGQSVVLPKAGLFNYGALRSFVRAKLKDPYIMQENARIMVLNGTSTVGVATANSNALKSYGYNVVGAANTPNSSWTHTTVVDLSKNKNKYTRNYLEKHFKVKAVNSMPDDTIGTINADFVIIIGSDEANTPQI